MYSHEPSEMKSSGPLARAVKIGLVLAACVLAVAGARWAYLHWASAETRNGIDTAVGGLRDWTQELFTDTKTKGEELAHGKLFDFNREQREKEAKEAAERRRRELLAAKAAAWEKFYVPKPECAHPGSNAQFVECGNEYHRARVRFDEMWQSKMKNEQR